MPRFWIGNFDFEHALAEPNWRPPARVSRINAELATAWWAIAEPGDFVWTPEPLPTHFLQRLEATGLPAVTTVTDFSQVPDGVLWQPWGWSNALRKLACPRSSTLIPPDAAVLLANSRQFTWELEQRWQVGLPGSGIAGTRDEFSRRVDALRGPWVAKANQGMSGRERILGHGSPTDAQYQWVQRRLLLGPVIVEPWVTRLEEAGIQWHIPQSGPVELMGIVPLFVDRSGQYRGSEFTRADPGQNWWTEATDVTRRAVECLQREGYFGPVGIDAMLYLSESGARRIRPLQDINARWTMGRLALGWRKWLRDGERGLWIQGVPDLGESLPAGTRSWDLTPPLGGVDTSTRRSVVHFFRDSP